MTLKVPLMVKSIEFQAESHCCSPLATSPYPTLKVTFLDGGGGSFYEMQPQSGFGFDADDGVALAAMLKAICEHNDAVEDKVAAKGVPPEGAGFPHTPP